MFVKHFAAMEDPKEHFHFPMACLWCTGFLMAQLAQRSCFSSGKALSNGSCARGARLLGAGAGLLREVMSATRYMQERSVVLVWDAHKIHGAGFDRASLARCSMRCEWTTDRSRVREASAIAFALAMLPSVSAALSLADRLRLPTIGISREKDDAERNRRFAKAVRVPPYFMTHRLDSHVPLVYFTTIGWPISPSGQHMLNPNVLQPQVKLHGATIAAFISNCKGVGPFSRLAILKDLAQHGVPVHHFGECAHNMGFRSNRHAADWHATKLGALKMYRFVAAMENTRVVDYVSEKVYDGLRSGVVPIYLGAPNVYDFLPCDQAEPCIIHVADYVRSDGRFDASRLSAYLRYLATNTTAYEKYFKWREQPASRRFIDMATIAKYSAACRMCHCIRGRLGCRDYRHDNAHLLSRRYLKGFRAVQREAAAGPTKISGRRVAT